MPTAEFEQFSRLLAGQYSLEREIGRGGMGVVYLARDLKLDRPVAIKTLPPHLAADVAIRERFLREARTAAKLSHPNIVPIYRADEIDGQVFFAMGYVDGESLAEHVVRGGPLDARDVLRTMRDVALALDYAHAHGVVHRDVKAENILIARDTGAAMVTDFGIARLAEATPLTATGQVLGTVYYMSPEQASGDRIDGRSDLYSLGVVGFYALTGRFPFDALLASAVLVAHVTKAAPPLLTIHPGVPRALAEIVDRCLAKDPADRYQSGAELAAELSRLEGDVQRDAGRAAVAPSAPRLLSDTEAQSIWSRAAALQAMTGVAPRVAAVPASRDTTADAARTSGYAVEAVREAAVEAGIASQYVEHAMAEHGLLGARSTAAPAPLPVRAADLHPREPWMAGGPVKVELECVVPGEMPDRDFDLLMEIIRRRLGEAGAVSAMGRSLVWNTLSRKRAVHVSVLARNGRTTIRVVEDMGSLAGALFGGIVGGAGGGFTGAAVGIGIDLFHSAVGVVGLEMVWLAGMYALARGIFAKVSSTRKQKLEALAEELASQVAESAGNPERHELGSPAVPDPSSLARSR